jgi:hypothetical protein
MLSRVFPLTFLLTLLSTPTLSQQEEIPVEPFRLPVVIIETPDQAAINDQRYQDSRQRELDDLSAQQSMAKSTARIEVYTLFEIGLAALGTVALVISLYLTTRALRITREFGMIQMRAYVFCEKTTIEWDESRVPTVTTQQRSIKMIVFHWRNSGLTPASKVEFKSTLLFLPGINYEDITEKYIDDTIAEMKQKPKYTWLAPGADLKTFTTSVPPEAVDKWQQGSAEIIIRGRAQYIDVFGQQHSSSSLFRLVHDETPKMWIVHFEQLAVGNHSN